MTFADKLKELRNGKNMSQEQLAEKLYVSRQAITKWETGAGLLFLSESHEKKEL